MILNNLSGFSDSLNENNLKKKGNDLLFYILQDLFKSNFLFFKIEFINLSYKDISYFLKSYGDVVIQEYNKNHPFDTMSNEELGGLFVWYLAKKIKKNPRFESCLFFYEFGVDCVSLQILLCLKIFAFDSLYLIDAYLYWFFKSVSHFFKSIDFLRSFDLFKNFFYNNIELKHLYYIYNDSYIYSSYNNIFRTYFLYNFYEEFISYFKIQGIQKQPVWDMPALCYPSALTALDKPSYMDIIHILSLYLTCKNAFLDINSGFIYHRNLTSKSTIVYMCSIEDLKLNFLSICYFLKNYIKKDFIAPFDFLNTNFPLLSVNINDDLLSLRTLAFDILKKDCLILQNLNSVVFSVFEFKNGYYAFKENRFYSFKLLESYMPNNHVKVKQIISYSYQDKSFSNIYFKKHSFMLFLKNLPNLQKKFYNSLFNVLFSLKPVSDFIIILKMDINLRYSCLKFLKQVYSNSPFIFLNLNYIDLNAFSCISFSKKLPLFIVVDIITGPLLKLLYKIYSQTMNKPLHIVLLVINTTDTSFLFSHFNCKLFDENLLFYNDLCSQFALYEYSFDLFVILNMFFFNPDNKKNNKKFLANYKKPTFDDTFDEVKEEWL